jgi:hypothetical protein
MKTSVIAASIFSLSVSGFPSILKRQFGGGGVFAGSPVVGPLKYEETAGTIRPNSRHVRATYGPYNVVPVDVGVFRCLSFNLISYRDMQARSQRKLWMG